VSELDEEQSDFFKTDHSIQYIVQVVLEDDTEHVICIYPRFWKEDKYLLYEDQKNHLVVHCIPQNSKVKLPKQIVQCMDADGLKNLRRSSGTNEVEEEYTKIDSHKVDSLDKIRGIISGVYHLGKLRDEKKRSSKEIEASLQTSTQGTSLSIHEQFLYQIEPLSRELRRTYSERVEEFGSIRGRLTNRGMLRLVTHPSNRFECRFDDFFVQAPIYRIISTCLKIIASSYNQSAFPWLDEQFNENRTKSMRLLFAFNEVEPYDTLQAIQNLRKFIRHPPIEFRKFHPICNTMMQILVQEQTSLATQGQNAPKFIHLEHSNLIWEDFLEKCLSYNADSVESQKPYETAWIGLGDNKNVDISINNGQVLIDAKYMKAKSATKAQYQHQMFYYMMSEIAENQQIGGPQSIILAYPVNENRFRDSDPKVFDLGKQFDSMFNKLDAEPTKLIRLAVPFPDQSRFNGFQTTEKVIKSIMQEFEEPFKIMTTGFVDEGES
jgi:5-methylcytosine-specific restriction endonuclease McrBC regulatory subunit McrC